jgi:hypothetical protein
MKLSTASEHDIQTNDIAAKQIAIFTGILLSHAESFMVRPLG